MTLGEIADRLGKSKRAVMEMVGKGYMPKPKPYRGTREVEFDDATMLRWFRNRRTGALNERSRRRAVRKSRRRLAADREVKRPDT